MSASSRLSRTGHCSWSRSRRSWMTTISTSSSGTRLPTARPSASSDIPASTVTGPQGPRRRGCWLWAIRTCREPSSTRQPLAPLPGAEREATAIGALYPPARVSTLVGSRARERTVRELAPGQTIIHLATHAVVFDEEPMGSYLALTPDSGSGTGARNSLGGRPPDRGRSLRPGPARGPRHALGLQYGSGARERRRRRRPLAGLHVCRHCECFGEPVARGGQRRDNRDGALLSGIDPHAAETKLPRSPWRSVR